MRLIWFPSWSCQFYTPGQSHGHNCPYCPLGLADGRMLYEGKPAGPNPPPREDVRDRIVAFLNRNGQTLGWRVELSGGEPLLYPHLAEVLKRTGYYFGITSNTQNRRAIEALAESGALAKCLGWTCSYHPVAGKDDVYTENLWYLSERLPRTAQLRATMVVSTHTLPRLDASAAFLRGLPLTGHQYHLDSHADGPGVPRAAACAAIASADPGAPVIAGTGTQPRGVLCDRFGVHVALSPAGHLHECVTKLHTDTDRLCEADGGTDLARLLTVPGLVAHCDLPCFACCDHAKHRAEHPQPAAPLRFDFPRPAASAAHSLPVLR